MKFVKVILFFTPLVLASYGSSSQASGKQNYEYAEQKTIANDIAAKSKVIPFQVPDWNSMVSINESGDGIINIPLATISGRKLSLPISLNYVTSGIKVDQNASEVGLGWSINFGSIKRDFGAYEPDYTYNGKETKMENTVNGINGWLFTNNGSNQILPSHQNKSLLYTGVNESYTPDLYYVNIPGVKSNSFWNTAHNTDANFVFTETEPTRIEYEKQNISICQEPSAINEISYVSDVLSTNAPASTNRLMIPYNLSAAIGFYPYVINQKVQSYTTGVSSCIPRSSLTAMDANYLYGQIGEPAKVEYQDYSKFVLTKPDGTKYIFGRPLRSQKYMFSEEPFWSSMRAPYPTSTSNVCYGELWKTDYIAEWLLTEIRSNDYVDANNNGIVDDGDYGDWIKIEYTKPYKYEVPVGINVPLKTPTYREWMNFTQTDRASSLMKENAYVTKITTPLQTIDFSNSERFDVEHDYYAKVFNRINGNGSDRYIYNIINKFIGWSPNRSNPENYFDQVPIEDVAYTANVNYPVETRKYDALSISENISGANNGVQYVKLNYAGKGSPQELAVSKYLIIDNNKQAFDYDPAQLNTQLIASNFNRSTGRGKSTLLGVDYSGAQNPTDKISFKFNYDFNPSYDNIHMYEILNQAASPAIRESPQVNEERWGDIRTLPGTNPVVIANSINPWKSLEIDKDYHFTSTENWNNPTYTDELGHYYDNQSALKGRNAWSLSSITLPYGGEVHIDYELDQTEITTDRNSWLNNNGIADYSIPSVAHYNNLAHVRSVVQNWFNIGIPSTSTMKHNYREYYYLLNENSGGLRIKKLNFLDPYTNTSVVKNYTYGAGHFSMPPYEYWQNYLKGYSSFMYNEKIRHEQNEIYSLNNGNMPFNSFQYEMMRLIVNSRVDNTIKEAKHYYEFVQETKADNSKTKWYYGALLGNNPIVSFPIVSGCIRSDFNDRVNYVELLNTNVDNSKSIGNYKTEYLNQSNAIVKSEQSDYSFTEDHFNNITLNQQNLVSGTYAPWIPQQPPQGGNSPILKVPTAAGNSNLFSNVFDNLSAPVVSGIGYSVPGTTSISSIGQAQSPLAKLGLGSGLYSAANMPSWFTPVAATTTSVNALYGPLDIQNKLRDLLDYWKNYNGGRWMQDGPYQVAGETYKSHQSYTLRPTHLTTILTY